MRILYARSNRIVRLFHSCSSDVLLELGVFVDRFTVTVVTCGHVTKNHRFPKFVWHIPTFILNFCMFQVAAVPMVWYGNFLFDILK